MAEVVVQSVKAGLADVFKYAYEANCQLEGEPLSLEDQITLSELSSIEIIENLKDLLESLLASKRELKKTDKAELVDRCEQFEKQLQKLENDVRTHIRVDVMQVEQQLKLHAEATQAKLDELMKGVGGEKGEEGRESVGEDSEEDGKKTTPSTGEWQSKGEGFKDVGMSHHRILSLERGVSEYKGDDRTRRLLDLAEKKHKSLLSLEHECSVLHFAFSQKRSEMESAHAEYERILREMQLSRLKASKENILRKQSNEKLGKWTGTSPDPMMTDRYTPLKPANVDRKSDHSPYLGANHARVASKGRLDMSPIDGGRQKAHCRTTSDRGNKRASAKVVTKA